MTKIFPAIDIMNGHCVRLTEGLEESQKRYDSSPLEMAIRYEEYGAENVHIVDLDAAFNKGNNYDVVREIIECTSLNIEIGGGIRTTSQVDELLSLGVSQVIVGSTAVKKPDVVKNWIHTFGADSIVIGADTKDGKIAINGWKDVSDVSLVSFIQDYAVASAQKFLCTDISKDGKMQGSSRSLYKELQVSFPTLDFLASGGVSSLQEIKELKAMNMYGIIVGKAIYEGIIPLENLFLS